MFKYNVLLTININFTTHYPIIFPFESTGDDFIKAKELNH